MKEGKGGEKGRGGKGEGGRGCFIFIYSTS